MFSSGSEQSSSGMIFKGVGGKGFSTLGSGIGVDGFEVVKKVLMPHNPYEHHKSRKVTQSLRPGIVQLFAYSPGYVFVDALTSDMLAFVFQGTQSNLNWIE